jgi:arylformamidase
MVANTGTYLDSPFHRYANGKDLSQLPLEHLANLQGVVVPADQSIGRAIDRSAFQGHDLRGKAVLVRTGWDAHWRTDQYFEGHPFLTKDAAEFLVEAGVALVGIDSLNIDDTGDLSRPVHSLLLAAEVPIVEHLRGLGRLPGFVSSQCRSRSRTWAPSRCEPLDSRRNLHDCRRIGRCRWGCGSARVG